MTHKLGYSWTWLQTNMRELSAGDFLTLFPTSRIFKDCISVLRCGRVPVKTATCQKLQTPPEREGGRSTGIYMSVRALHGQRRSCDLLLIAWCRSEVSQSVSHLFSLFRTWTLDCCTGESLSLHCCFVAGFA